MKIAVICNADSLAIPSLSSLKEKGLLASVAIPERSKAYLYNQISPLIGAEEDLVIIPEEGHSGCLKEWLEKYRADMVWVFGCPWKIPHNLLSIPSRGFINFHFGLMPDYRGADPIFWQINNREKKCGLVVHRMTEVIDHGPIIWKEETDAVPGENYAMHCIRMGLMAAQLQDSLLKELAENNKLGVQQDGGKSLYLKRPGTKELTINWKEQTSEEIIALINACNPKYGGASTSLRGMELRVLEADVITVNGSVEAAAGTIVHADAVYGLVVACNDKKFVRLNVIHIREGYVSGIRLFGLGARAGELFN